MQKDRFIQHSRALSRCLQEGAITVSKETKNSSQRLTKTDTQLKSVGNVIFGHATLLHIV